jgi:hypothetical protein
LQEEGKGVEVMSEAKLRGDDKSISVRADFNGLFGELLCLTHSDFCPDENGNQIRMQSGLKIMAFDHDVDEAGERDDLIATGMVEAAPSWLACRGSKWVLRIDGNGVRHRSDLPK